MTTDSDNVEPFERTLSIGITSDHRGVVVDVEWDGERLSLTGQIGRGEGSRSGQIKRALIDDTVEEWRGDWTAEKALNLYRIWDRWHCNHMQPGTPAQMEELRERDVPADRDYLEWAREILMEAHLEPDDGYSFGSEWLYEEVPPQKLRWLRDVCE